MSAGIGGRRFESGYGTYKELYKTLERMAIIFAKNIY